MKKKTPRFKSEHAEHKFWGRADSTDYVDWETAQRVVLPNLKPSQTTISLRLPSMMLAERLDKELRPSETKGTSA